MVFAFFRALNEGFVPQRPASRPVPLFIMRKPLVSLEDSRLTFIEYTSRRSSSCGKYAMYKCSCGNIVERDCQSVRQCVRSCWCLSTEVKRNRWLTHGETNTKLYRLWGSMVNRCYTPSAWNYALYGGRGIRVCDRWRYSYENFKRDMWPRPEWMSIDRVDNNWDYEPWNCRWATKKQQWRNRRTNRLYEFEWEKMTIFDVADRTWKDVWLLRGRMKAWWTLQEALSTPNLHGKKLLRPSKNLSDLSLPEYEETTKQLISLLK